MQRDNLPVRLKAFFGGEAEERPTNGSARLGPPHSIYMGRFGSALHTLSEFPTCTWCSDMFG